MSLDLVIRNGLVITQNAAREVKRADVLVRDGRIHAIAPTLERQGAARVIDASGQWVVPGFVQAHIHLTQTVFRGLADDRELLPWLRDRIWPLEDAHDEETNHASAELGIAELLLSGTTTLLDMGTTRHHHVVYEAARDAGIGYVGGKALMDKGEGAPPTLLQPMEQALRECDAHLAKYHGLDDGRVRVCLAPRFILSCSDELMRRVGERSRSEGLLIHTHSSENSGEVAAVRAITGAANLRALQALGCLHDKTVIAHGVWIEGDEEECIVESGAAVCHCPGSNLKLASGVSPVTRLLGRGVRMALGADGAACNNTLDQRYEMRLAATLQNLAQGAAALPAQAVLDMATRGGAQALGMGDELGSIEVGKRADLVCMQPLLGAQPVADPVRALVYSASALAVRTVVVAGRCLVEDGALVRTSERAIAARVERAQRRLEKTLGR